MSFAMRLITPLVAVAALAISGSSEAQVTIHFTSAQGACDITTDANGLRLTPGGTDLAGTIAAKNGPGCGAAGGGPTPDNFTLSVTPSAPISGTAFSVAWTVTGADTCTGSATLNGTPLSSLSGWTDTTSATSPRSVTASTAGTYMLSLTCANASAAVNSLPATVIVASGDACPVTPRTRATTSDINYRPGTHIRHGVDLREWENIWGHLSDSDDGIPFPGPNGASPTIQTLGKNQYIAAEFDTGTLPTNYSGAYTNVSYGAGPNLDMSISTACGDFAPTTPGCLATNVSSGENYLVWWRMVNGNDYTCALQPNTHYYLNLQFHDPATTGPGCTGNTCITTIQSNHQ